MRTLNGHDFLQNAAIRIGCRCITVDFPLRTRLDNKTAARNISGPPQHHTHQSSQRRRTPNASVLSGSSQLAEANVRFLRRLTVRLGQLLPDYPRFRVFAGGHQAASLKRLVAVLVVRELGSR